MKKTLSITDQRSLWFSCFLLLIKIHLNLSKPGIQTPKFILIKQAKKVQPKGETLQLQFTVCEQKFCVFSAELQMSYHLLIIW